MSERAPAATVRRLPYFDGRRTWAPALEPLRVRLVTGAIKRGSHAPNWPPELSGGVAKTTTALKVELTTIELTVRDSLVDNRGRRIAYA
jgi:4'-phosphopantetheinyl transferase EntD